MNTSQYERERILRDLHTLHVRCWPNWAMDPSHTETMIYNIGTHVRDLHNILREVAPGRLENLQTHGFDKPTEKPPSEQAAAKEPSPPTAPDTGGPAFPIPIAGCADGCVYNGMEATGGQLGGMTLLDWFASQEHLTDFDRLDVSPEYMQAVTGEPYPPSSSYQYTAEDLRAKALYEAKFRAKLRYIRADAMLAARKEHP